MLNKELTAGLKSSIDEIKSPAHRINILMPVLACLFLAAWLFTLVKGSSKDLKTENKSLRIELRQVLVEKEKIRQTLQLEINDINNKRYQESREQVERLQKIYSGQTDVKEAIEEKLNK